MIYLSVRRLFPALPGLLAGLALTASALAIDNPDTPDIVAQFEARAQPFEARIGEAASVRETALANGAYQRFLDGELNQAYQALAGKLGPTERAALARSERSWLSYRDREFAFIDQNWTPEHFGLSAALSRGDYRSALVKQRTVTLLQYLENYP